MADVSVPMTSKGYQFLMDELKRLKKLVAKKRQSARYKNDELKLAKYLTSQGFSYQLVKETLKLHKP